MSVPAPTLSHLSQLSQLKQKRYVVSVMTLLMIGAVVWVSTSLLGTYRRTKIPPETQAMAKPLTPSLDLTVLEDIEQRRTFTSEELATFPIYKLIIDPTTNRERIVPLDYQPTPSPITVVPTTVITSSPTPSPSLLNSENLSTP